MVRAFIYNLGRAFCFNILLPIWYIIIKLKGE